MCVCDSKPLLLKCCKRILVSQEHLSLLLDHITYAVNTDSRRVTHSQPHIFMAFSLFVARVSIKDTSVAKLGSVCRRVYRIFSHAYFHHRGLFDEYEVRLKIWNQDETFAFNIPVVYRVSKLIFISE